MKSKKKKKITFSLFLIDNDISKSTTYSTQLSVHLRCMKEFLSAESKKHKHKHKHRIDRN